MGTPTLRRTFAAMLATSVVFGAGIGFATANSGDDSVTATCTPSPTVSDTGTTLELTVTCTVPKPPEVTQTVEVPGPTTTATVTSTATATVTTTVTATPTPTPTATATPTATPTTPPSGGYGNASNTGVPSGVALTPSGSLNVTTAGAVIQNLDITGNLTITANNVTVRNTRVTSGDFWVVNVKGSGAKFDHVTVRGQGLSGGEGTSGVVGSGTFDAVNVSQVENGFVPGTGSIIRNSYVHDLNASGSPHYDGIQIDGGVTNIRVTGSTIHNQNGQTAAVMVDNFYGAVSGIVVDGNRLLGGGYTVYADGAFNTSALGVTYSNNRFQKGYYGYSLRRGANATVTWSGNVDDSTGATIN